jgi:hypothetical protein
MANNNIPISDLAYIAGFIDGEGCLHISKRKPGRNRKTMSYAIKILISNTKISILKWIQSLFEGSLHKLPHRELNRANAYQLQFNVKDSYKLLSLIYPYLKLKKTQADILLKFLELRKSFPKKGAIDEKGGSLPSCNKYLELQEQYYQDIKTLNMRGINA